MHKSWLIVDVDCKNTAKCIVPPNFRGDAKVIQLNKFTPQEIQNLVQKLSMEPEGSPDKTRGAKVNN